MDPGPSSENWGIPDSFLGNLSDTLLDIPLDIHLDSFLDILLDIPGHLRGDIRPGHDVHLDNRPCIPLADRLLTLWVVRLLGCNQ
jgi:hypothetical protein